MNKINKYQKLYQEIKNKQCDENIDMIQISKNNKEFLELQTDLIFEIVKALQFIAKQNTDNKKEIKNLSMKVKEMLGEPIAIELMGEDDIDDGENC